MPVVMMVIALAGELFFTGSSRILRRHDRDDSMYIALAGRFAPAMCQVGNATGTLISDRWVVTAAHVAANISPFSRSVVCGGEHRQIKATYARTLITRDQAASSATIGNEIIDLALVELDQPIMVKLPVQLNRDLKEKGKSIFVVGTGLSGTGDKGPDTEDGKLRAATNVIDEADGQYVRFSFSPPDDKSATHLEGIGGPGDSGGPAFIEKNGKLYIAGVSSINSKLDAAGPSQYKSVESYSRISTNVRWIESVMRHEVRADSVMQTVIDVRSAWPTEHGAQLAKAFVDAFDSKDSATIAAFEQEYRADTLLAKRPAGARSAGWQRINDQQWGNLKPAAYTRVENRVMLLVESARIGWMRLEFLLDDAGKIERMRTSQPEDPWSG